ncbi:MAG: hypothetical protein WC489_06235 [Patescibacteria group bacterium]|jgi:hypothetical protein
MAYYVGVKSGARAVFTAKKTPTVESHGEKYGYVIGPFRTKAAAELMRDTHPNPHIQTVADAERIAKRLKGK